MNASESCLEVTCESVSNSLQDILALALEEQEHGLCSMQGMVLSLPQVSSPERGCSVMYRVTGFQIQDCMWKSSLPPSPRNLVLLGSSVTSLQPSQSEWREEFRGRYLCVTGEESNWGMIFVISLCLNLVQHNQHRISAFSVLLKIFSESITQCLKKEQVKCPDEGGTTQTRYFSSSFAFGLTICLSSSIIISSPNSLTVAVSHQLSHPYFCMLTSTFKDFLTLSLLRIILWESWLVTDNYAVLLQIKRLSLSP